MPNGFLPISKQDLIADGIDRPDFVYVSGDAYVDHSSFGTAIICRLLQSRGYSVALICQPDWRDPKSVQIYGEPRLGFLVSSGNMDSMVNHYTVAKKRRHQDAYSPGGAIGKRPDYAVIVYCNLIRQTYKRTPIIIGGIEASLRRLSHYDYWSDKVRRSILLDSGADLISYGMGEHSIPEIADALASGLDIRDITYIDGTVYKTRDEESIYDAIRLPDFEQVRSDKRQYACSFAVQHENTDPFQAKRLYEAYDGKLFVVQNPPAKPLTTQEMDDVYALPFMRAYHPSYEKDGGIPALSEIKFSLTSNRGCFGDCNFCALTFHEGRIVQARSHKSILEEAKTCLEVPPRNSGAPPATSSSWGVPAKTGAACILSPAPTSKSTTATTSRSLESSAPSPASKKCSSGQASDSTIFWQTRTGPSCGNFASIMSADSCAWHLNISRTMCSPKWANPR